MKYKYKIGEKVWANIHPGGLPWHKGSVFGRFKNADEENIYKIREHVSGKGCEVREEYLRKA